MEVRFTLYIEYDDPVDFKKVADQLLLAADHLYDNGLLSGSGDVYVKSYTPEVCLLDHEEQVK